MTVVSTRALATCVCLISWSCADSAAPSAAADSSDDEPPPAAPELTRSQLPLPPEALVMEGTRPRLCERTADDIVREKFCAEQGPSIRSLTDLQVALKLSVAPDGAVPNGDAPQGAYPQSGGAVLLGHSTALSGDLVSPLNPRAIVMTYNNFMAFNRGVQQVEIAARDRETQRFNLYLLSFHQACNLEANGCKPGDLYTPRIESDWQQIALQDDEDLANTASDCRQCHQRGQDKPMLLMRELDGPWTHFFSAVPSGKPAFPEALGDDLVSDYVAAKGEEPYGGVSVPVMNRTIGFTLQTLVPAEQPVIFDGAVILDERWPWSPDGYATEPHPSSTWQLSYDAFKRGEILALPHYAMRPTDPDKQAQLTAAYASWRAGDLPTAELPDLADIFADDPQTRAELGLQTEPDAAAPDLLIQACAQCHSDVLDQTLSRARFNVALGRLEPSELAAAVRRLELPRGSTAAMPPRGRRQLDEAARAKLIAYLKSSRTSADDERLERVAQLGMAQKQPKSAEQLSRH